MYAWCVILQGENSPSHKSNKNIVMATLSLFGPVVLSEVSGSLHYACTWFSFLSVMPWKLFKQDIEPWIYCVRNWQAQIKQQGEFQSLHRVRAGNLVLWILTIHFQIMKAQFTYGMVPRTWSCWSRCLAISGEGCPGFDTMNFQRLVTCSHGRWHGWCHCQDSCAWRSIAPPPPLFFFYSR